MSVLEVSSSIKEFLSLTNNTIERIDQSSIEKAVRLIIETWRNDGNIFIAGNGGSASTATHFACDLNKWACEGAVKRIRATALVDNIPLVSALTNDNGFSEVYYEQLQNFFKAGDLFIAISVHGGSGKDKAGLWSQNLLKAAKYAKDSGGKSMALLGFDGGVLKDMVDVSVLVPVNSTPQVEGIHLVLTHLICDEIRKRIVPPEKLGSRA